MADQVCIKVSAVQNFREGSLVLSYTRAPVSVVSVLHVEHKNDVKHIQSLPLPLQPNHDAKLRNGLAMRRPRRVSSSVLC